MIIDTIKRKDQYYKRHPYFKKAFEFLSNDNLCNIVPGRYEIEGFRLYAKVYEMDVYNENPIKLETHLKYIDIIYVISGVGVISLKQLSRCNYKVGNYDEIRDVQYYSDNPDSFISLIPGHFVILFDNDVHAINTNKGRLVYTEIKVIKDVDINILSNYRNILNGLFSFYRLI